MWAPVILHVIAGASYMCEHMLATRASTCFLHMRARYLLYVLDYYLKMCVQDSLISDIVCLSVGLSEPTNIITFDEFFLFKSFFKIIIAFAKI